MTTIGFPSVELGLLVVAAFLAGFLFRHVIAGRTAGEHFEKEVRLHISLLVLSEAHVEAVSMLAENDRIEELTERVQDRLSDLEERMDKEMELAEVDPIGAKVLGEDRERVWWPKP